MQGNRKKVKEVFLVLSAPSLQFLNKYEHISGRKAERNCCEPSTLKLKLKSQSSL